MKIWLENAELLKNRNVGSGAGKGLEMLDLRPELKYGLKNGVLRAATTFQYEHPQPFLR